MFVFSLAFLGAQEAIPEEDDEENDPSIESDWSMFDTPSYQSGDQMIGLGLGMVFPIFFTDYNTTIDKKVNPGGTIFMSYDFFFHPSFSVGAEVNFSFNSTLGENMLYLVPMAVRLTYQLVLHPIEIPITVAVGMAPQAYLDENYLGLYIKPSLGAFWRMNADWSFGVHGTWWWLPQWTKISSEDVYGNFITAAISARYHF
jgi:hypothetical protein